MSQVQLIAVTSLPEIHPGDDLCGLLSQCEPSLIEGDILVVTQKVVSKAEGRLVRLEDVEPGERAQEIAQKWEKDARLVELVLGESRELLREDRGVLIARTHHGFVCANAGIDLSNIDGGETACLLPLDSDRSARELSERVSEQLGFKVPVVISDSFGRPWRQGITNVALGSYGLEVLLDHRGTCDPFGLEMKATVMAVADTLAASTELVVGKTLGYGACIVRGYAYEPSETSTLASSLRPWDQCFFL